MTQIYRFNCGCGFPILKELPHYSMPLLDFSYKDINWNCSAVWDMAGKAISLGCFQLESNLGRKYLKELKPKSIEHLSALTAILRPGSLNSVDEKGKNLCQKYCDRANGREPIDIEFPAIKHILDETYQILCVHEDTNVSLESGYHQKIKNVKISDSLSTWDENNKKMTNNECHGCSFSKISDGYKITLKNGYSVILTEDHKILTWEGYKEVKDLSISNDIVCCPTKIHVEGTNINLADWLGNNESVAYLFGYIVGNGNTIDRNLLCVGEEWKADALIKWIHTNLIGFVIKKYFNTRCWYLELQHNVRANDIRYGGKKTKIRVLLENNGLLGNSFHKRIPDSIFSSTDNVKWAFLAGYFDSDGHGSKNCRHIASSNINLIQDLRQLFLSLGIINIIQPNHIHIMDIENFDKYIEKYLVIRKNQLVGPKFDGKCSGVLPSDVVLDAIKKTGLGSRLLIKNYNIRKPKGRFSKYKTGEKLGLCDTNVRYFNIKKIEKVTNQKFYSISVANTHNFVGNGIIIKNCYQEQQIAIAQEVCGFSPSKADELRRGCAKKKADLLLSLEKEFVEGAEGLGKITRDNATKIFEWIKNASRYSFNRCLHPDTEVLSKTTKKYKKIRDLQVGEFIYAPNTKVNFWDGGTWVKIKNVYNNGIKNISQIIFDTGESIRCTLDHKFYCCNVGVSPLYEIIDNNYSVMGTSYTHNHIKAVIPVGEINTMDIEVDSDDHLFIANNLITSNSHSTLYGIRSYVDFYLKSHFPLQFYTAKLKSPRKSTTSEDIADLIYEMKSQGIETKLPDVRDMRPLFYNDGKSVYFGLSDIKGYGGSAYESLSEVHKNTEGKLTSNFFEFAVTSSLKLPESKTILLIEAGALDWTGLTRTQMLEEFKLLSQLTKGERDKLGKYLQAQKEGVFNE